jgi:hypothetical protein
LKLTADPGLIGAKLFIGRDAAYNNSLGYLELQTSGNMTFYRDATIGIALLGVADLNQGGIKLFNMGGGGPGTGTGWFENWGTTTVNGTIPSDMYFYNKAGMVTVAADKTLDIAGSKTLPDASKTSFHTDGGATTLRPGAILRLAQRYYQSNGQLLCDDTGAAAAAFTVNGNVDIDVGVLQMGTAANTFGNLSISGWLRFGDTSALNIHASGPNNACDKINVQAVILVGGCGLGVETTGVPNPAVPTEREFLVVGAGGVTGIWGGLARTGDFTQWTMHENQKKLIFAPPPTKG